MSCIRIPGYIWPKAGDLGKSDDTALVGLFVHGGGCMPVMGNGSETFGECGMRLYYYYSFFYSLNDFVSGIARKITKVLFCLFFWSLKHDYDTNFRAFLP